MAGRSKKTNLARRFDGGGRRPDNTKHKREEAAERQAAWDALNTNEKIAILDLKLGTGQGAKKQRAKLAKPATAKTTTTKPVEAKSE